MTQKVLVLKITFLPLDIGPVNDQPAMLDSGKHSVRRLHINTLR